MTHPDPLFPHIGPAAAAALFHGLDGAPSPPVDHAAWEADLRTITRQRLSALALAAARAGSIALSPAIEQTLRARNGLESATTLKNEATAVEAVTVLQDAGIPCVILKGPGMAQAYPHVSQRPFTDADALVPARSFVRAAGVLGARGFREPASLVQPREYFNRLCREAVNLTRDDHTSIDLHHHIPPWVWGARISFERISGHAQPLKLDLGTVSVPDPVHNLLIAALHVVSDKSRPGQSLIVWRDVLAMSAACDPARAADEARAVRLDWLLAFIIDQLPVEVRPRALREELGEPARSRTDAWRLRRLLPPGIGSKLLAHTFRIPPPNAIAYLAGYTVPARPFLKVRYEGDASYLRWWRDSLRGVWSTIEH